jgi:hypothetical protein
MSPSSVEITDKDHWRKEIPLQKAIIYIGCDPGNDVVLDPAHGAGVASRNVQLLSLPVGGLGYRLVNLGDAEIRSGSSGDRVIPPRSFTDVADGDRLQLGDFVLTFRLGADVAALAAVASAAPAPGPSGGPPSTTNSTTNFTTATSIGMSLALPETQLAPDRPLEGSVTVRNQGSKLSVQFKLQVEGLEPDCYEIGAAPVLFPGAEKSVVFRLLHSRRPRPLAGEHRFSIRATAAEAYPGESAVVSQVIRILPFYSHKLAVISS